MILRIQKSSQFFVLLRWRARPKSTYQTPQQCLPYCKTPKNNKDHNQSFVHVINITRYCTATQRGKSKVFLNYFSFSINVPQRSLSHRKIIKKFQLNSGRNGKGTLFVPTRSSTKRGHFQKIHFFTYFNSNCLLIHFRQLYICCWFPFFEIRKNTNSVYTLNMGKIEFWKIKLGNFF